MRELAYVDLSDPSRHIDSRGLRPIAPCPPPLPGRQSVTAILWSRLQGSDCKSFRFSRAPALTIGSTTGMLVGYSGGQFARHL